MFIPCSCFRVPLAPSVWLKNVFLIFISASCGSLSSFGAGPIGMSFNQFEEGRWRLVVTRTDPGAAAEGEGVAPGDLITEVGRVRVRVI